MDSDLMERTLKALEHLNAMYRVDRYLSMAAAVASFLLLFYIALQAFEKTEVRWELLASFFGASGFLTVAMLRIAYFFNEGHKLIAQIVKAEIDRGGA